MGYPSSVDTGQIAPLFLGEDAFIGGASSTLTANTVYVIKYVLQAPCIVTGMRWKTTTTAAGNVDLGVYDSGGNLLAHLGSTANTAVSTVSSANFSTALALSPGVYHLAFTVGNGTDTFTRSTALAPAGSAIVPAYTAANNSTGTTSPVLPSTLGTLTAANNCPIFGAVVSGGI